LAAASGTFRDDAGAHGSGNAGGCDSPKACSIVIGGLLYGLVYAGAIAPGIFLGRRLAGARHPAGWIIGGVIGYGLTQLALWVPIILHVPSLLVFVGAWAVELAVVWALARRITTSVLPLPAHVASDTRALALTLLLATVVMWLPYRNLGRADDTGTRYYRAYFTADFFWHTALAAELGRYATPPRDPYMASREMHYYWTYFLLPSVVAHESPAPLNDVQRALKVNAGLSALLVIGMLYLFVRTAVPRPGAAAAAVAVGFLAASAEGTFVLQQLWHAGRPIVEVTDMNIDAITNWQFGGLRVDGLPRGLWYNPQHSFACALGLVAGLVAATGGARSSRGAIWLAGVSLGLSTCFNPFVGGVFSIIYGVSVALDALPYRNTVRTLLRHAQAALPVVVALGWCALNKVTSGAADAVHFGFSGYAPHNTLVSLLLSTGPVLVTAVAGLWPWRSLPAQPARVAIVGMVLSLLLMHLLTLSEGSWVGFRTGQILLLMLPLLIARTFWALTAVGTQWTVAVAAIVLVAGLPTTIIDTYNAQDIGNRRPGPGFRWTVPVTAAQQAAFAWVQAHVPENAIVQMEPMVRGRDHWSLIPSFAQRRMSAGLPISLLPVPEYVEGSAQVRQIYRTSDPREARQLAKERGIQYFYIDEEDRAAYPDGMEKFGGAYFDRSYDSSGVTIVRVR
jgi:hypothetical protein